MKQCVCMVMMVGLLLFARQATAQEQEVQQLLLNVEKLAQLKAVLEDLKKGYEIVANGYSTIKELSEGNFHLHEVFLNSLLDVSPTVKNYRRIADIIQAQLRLVKSCKTAFRQYADSQLFSPEELRYLQSVFEHVFNQSVQNLEALVQVITAGTLRMSDEQRLTAIDAIWTEVSDQWTFIQQLNRETKLLALQRAKAAAEVGTLKHYFSNK